MTTIKKHVTIFIALCILITMISIPISAEVIDTANKVVSIEIQNLPIDKKIPTEVKEIIQYYFNIRKQSLIDAFSLDNSKNTLLEKEDCLKSKINNSILEREDERIYEIQRYYVLGSGTDYYANCNLDYHCDFYEQYTEANKLYIVVTEFIRFTEDDGTIATSIGIAHTLEFINSGNSYSLNNDAYTDEDFTGTKVDKNGLITKGLLYPEVDLKAIVSDVSYNKITTSRGTVDNVRALATYAPGMAVSYALTYYGTPNYKDYKYFQENDCANFVSQCLLAGNLAQKSASAAYPWYYNRSSTVCSCSYFNRYHTCRNNDTSANDWINVSLRTNLVNNSYGRQLYAPSNGSYSCSAMTAGDLLFVTTNLQGNLHAYICVGYNSSTGKLKFADHNIEGNTYGDVVEKDIYYMSNFYIIDMYVQE